MKIWQTHLAFTDIEKAYNINRWDIWKEFHKKNVSKGIMERIKNIYYKCENSGHHWQKIRKFPYV
jgi:hypothetical protein